MKHEDYWQQKSVIEKELAAVKSKKFQLQKRYMSELPFAEGDKVQYTNPKHQRANGVYYVYSLRTEFGEVVATLSEPKKDGTMSAKSCGIKVTDFDQLTKL